MGARPCSGFTNAACSSVFTTSGAAVGCAIAVPASALPDAATAPTGAACVALLACPGTLTGGIPAPCRAGLTVI